jgi:2-hydroxy-6-oxonona-2,4-dienedioate hydrolase
MVANPTFVSPFMAEIFIRNISTLDAKYAFKLTVEKSSNTQIGPEGLEKIRIPTLIIWGSEDKVIPAEHAKVFHRQIFGSQLHKIMDTGHAPFIEKPSVVFDLVRNFLTNY